MALRHYFFFSSRRRHTRCSRDWSSDVCSSDLGPSASKPGSLASRRSSRPRDVTRRSAPRNPGATCWVKPRKWPRLRRRCSSPGSRGPARRDRKSTRLNSSHGYISYAVFCLKKKKKKKKKLKHMRHNSDTKVRDEHRQCAV